MVIACWSVKGGSGTTVAATALAVRLARSAAPALMADLGGDVAPVLGRPESPGPGVGEWLAAGPDVAADGLRRLATEAIPDLSLVPAGRATAIAGATTADGERLVAELNRLPFRAAVVDCGSTITDVALGVAAAATRSLLVIRPCFLALRRAVAAPIRPSAVLLVMEHYRSLGPGDVEDVLGVPVLPLPWDPAIARAVDAGLLATRIPRQLDRALRAAA